MDKYLIIIAVMMIGSLMLMAFLVIFHRAREKKRTENLREVAAELSFEFIVSDDRLLARLGEFPLLSQGRSREMKNVMNGTSSDTEVSIFDYRYTTGSGKNSQTHHQTAVCFRSKRLHLPNFELRPERWYHKIGSMLGYQDIDFADYPEFSRRYLLRSDDEPGVRDLFTATAIERIEGHSDICVEGRADRLIVFRAGKRVKPMEVRNLLTTGFDVYSALALESDV